MKLGLIFYVWLIAVIAGFGYTMGWGYSPGESAHASQPGNLKGKDQVQAIIHPLCPCSEATLDLLRQSISTSTIRPSIEVIFSGKPQNSKNVQLAKRIPGAKISFSNEAELLQRFGKATSGHLFIWREGKLTFSGGITDARGEQSKGVAFEQFQRALTAEAPVTMTLPTYGCPVQGAN